MDFLFRNYNSGFYLLPIRSQVPHDVHGLDRCVNYMIVLYKFF